MNEMTVVEFVKTRSRMCSKYKCSDCPIYIAKKNKDYDCNCIGFILDYPEEAVAIVQKWSEEHPQKTMLQDFFEKFPKAIKSPKGHPKGCPQDYGYTTKQYCGGVELICDACWNRPLEED